MNERIVSLKNLSSLTIADNAGNNHFGCSQEWYGSKWKRMAGCGPSTATNLLLYLHRTKSIKLALELNDQEGCIKLMEAVWHYVTPTFKGVHTAKQFYNGLHRFAKANGFELSSFSLTIPKQCSLRLEFSAVVEFIRQGLILNSPVAFLNLSNGMVKNLDSWHWVTIVSLKTQEDDVFVQVYDGAKAFDINLKLWYETTTAGGGFVYVNPVLTAPS